MKIVIRPETPFEYNEVDNVIYEAFSEQHGIETGKFMKRHFVDERRKDTYIPELTLSQCAVLPEYRKQGIMRMLVEEGLKIAKNKGYGAVFLGGNTMLYFRFGFEPSYKCGIYHKDREKWGDEGFMVCLLRQGALDGITGITDYYGG